MRLRVFFIANHEKIKILKNKGVVLIDLERRNMDYRVNQNLVKEDELKNEAIDPQSVRSLEDLTKATAS
ncbi:hypothetical protein LCGC14_1802610 [marine sediment metagenome]|uniref:Uncharacterized protein n=1 Tax=marine sediment metagenome TaxID=412755 RepID=A0A0F9JNS7_9ZZZZ